MGLVSRPVAWYKLSAKCWAMSIPPRLDPAHTQKSARVSSHSSWASLGKRSTSGFGSSWNFRVAHFTQLAMSSEDQACGSTGTSTGETERLESLEFLRDDGGGCGEGLSVSRGTGTGKLRAGVWLLWLLLLLLEEDPESEDSEDSLVSLVELLLHRLLLLLLLEELSFSAPALGFILFSFASSWVSFRDPMLFCRTSWCMASSGLCWHQIVWMWIGIWLWLRWPFCKMAIKFGIFGFPSLNTMESLSAPGCW